MMSDNMMLKRLKSAIAVFVFGQLDPTIAVFVFGQLDPIFLLVVVIHARRTNWKDYVNIFPSTKPFRSMIATCTIF